MHDLRKSLFLFWKKLNNDWVPNLSALLAYNFLIATFPLLLLLLAIVGFGFGFIDPKAEHDLLHNLSNTFPMFGNNLISAASANLRRNAGILLVLGLGSSIFLGSRAFITLEDCFSIIYRMPSRSLRGQNLMALGLLLLYIVLVPFFFLLSIIPTAIISRLDASKYGGLAGALLSISALVGTVIVAMTIFGILFLIIPSRRPQWAHIWPGTLMTSLLLMLYEKIFPLYTGLILRPENFGSIAGFAIVIVIFYYYLAFILLLGAELNSWLAGNRASAVALTATFHDLNGRVSTAATIAAIKKSTEPDALSPPGKT